MKLASEEILKKRWLVSHSDVKFNNRILLEYITWKRQGNQ